MKIIADLHTHTNVSHHALSTFEEMIAGAKRAGHKAIAITNHTNPLGDGAHEWHFTVYNQIPKIIDGIAIIAGCETNIYTDGSVDLDKSMQRGKKLDYVIASIHEPVFGLDSTYDEITNVMQNILENPNINTFGHLGDPRYKFDYEKIISKCNEYNKVVEINSGSEFSRKGSDVNCLEIIKLCKKHNVQIALTSDSHISYTVGRIDMGARFVKEVEYPLELIINATEENLRNYFLKQSGIDIFNR